MTQVRLCRHPFKPKDAEVFDAASIGDWLLQHYGAVLRVHLRIYAGEPSKESDLTGNAEALARNDEPFYTVLETPGDMATIGYMILNLAISTAIGAIVQSLTEPDKPLANRAQESPNNSLTSRENRARPLERIEDIFGTVRSIPSLLMPTYSKYIEHRRVEYSLMCIGAGYYDLADVREGDTELVGITGASAEFFWPFTSPNSGSPILSIGDPITDPVLLVTRSSGVESIVLKAWNQLQLQSGTGYYFIAPGFAGVGDSIPENPSAYDMVYQPEGWRRPNLAAVAEVGQDLTIAMSAAPVIRAIVAPRSVGVTAASKMFFVDGGSAGFWNGAVIGGDVIVSGLGAPYDGTFTIASFNSTELVVVESLGAVDLGFGTDGSFTIDVDWNDTRPIVEVGNAYVLLGGTSVFSGAQPISGSFIGAPAADLTVDNALSDWTDWYVLPQVDRTEVWGNFVALRGMSKDDGSKSGTEVAYTMEVEQLSALLVPLGVVETVAGLITGATSNERAETLEQVTAWTGPARVRARRTTPFDFDFLGVVTDEITWTDLMGVVPVTIPHFGNLTCVHTVTRATPGAASVQRRELNCLASRLLPTYNGTVWSGAFDATGLHVSGTINPTSRIIDILAAITIDPHIGGRDIADLDIAQMWGVQQELDAWHADCGTFSYTFDNNEISYEETVRAVADAAFCRAYRQNGVIRLAFDQANESSTALFTHHNKDPNPDAETITRKFSSDSDHDGVELVYADPETESQETIRVPVGGGFTRPKVIEITGIRSYEQAWYRANRELNRLRYQRLSMETNVTVDARALLPNARIDVVDNTSFRDFSGEVRGQDGLELLLDQDVEFIPAEPHSIILKQRDGTPQSIAVTAGSTANRVVLAGAPAETILTESSPEDGIRTLYSFAADSARDAMAWLVQELTPSEDGYVKLACINYASEYYAADSEAVPAKDSVIND